MVQPGPLLVATVIMEFTSPFFHLILPLCPLVIIQLPERCYGDSRILADIKPMDIDDPLITVVNSSNADFDRPTLSNYTVSPSTVDISSGTQTLTLNITASDASGVVTPTSYPYFTSTLTTTMVQPGPLLVVTVIMEFTSQFFYLIHLFCALW